MPVLAGPMENQVNQKLVDREIKKVHGIVQLPVLWIDLRDGNGTDSLHLVTLVGNEVRELEGVRIGAPMSSWVKKQILDRYRKSAAHAVNETATVTPIFEEPSKEEFPVRKSSINVLGGGRKKK